MTSTVYLYYMPASKFNELAEENKFSFGKMSRPLFSGSDGKIPVSFDNKMTYYVKSDQSCREGLARDIQMYGQFMNQILCRHPSFNYVSYKRIMRINSKDFMNLRESGKEILYNNLQNMFENPNNYTFIRDLGSCVCIDFTGSANIPMVSLFTFIMRDCIKYLSRSNGISSDDLIKHILAGKIYGDDWEKDSFYRANADDFTKYYFLFNAFGIWLFNNYRHLYYSGSYINNVNGVCSYVQYVIRNKREGLKRFKEFIKKFEVDDFLLNKISATNGSKSKIGIKEEIKLLDNFYNKRDGRDYG